MWPEQPSLITGHTHWLLFEDREEGGHKRGREADQEATANNPAATIGAWTRVEAIGVARSTSLNPMEVPFLQSNISSFIWSDLTGGFWMCLDNTIFFPLKIGRT